MAHFSTKFEQKKCAKRRIFLLKNFLKTKKIFRPLRPELKQRYYLLQDYLLKRVS